MTMAELVSQPSQLFNPLLVNTTTKVAVRTELTAVELGEHPHC